MFCPRCGQKPAAHAVRFCASCGMRLDGVAQLIANDGFLPAQNVSEQPAPSLRQEEMRKGAKTLMYSFVSFPLFFALCFIPNNPVPLLVPATLFIAGACWMLYARLFCSNQPVTTKKLSSPETYTPPVYFPPVPVHSPSPLPPSAIQTAEIEPPRSIVEHTTRHLVKE